MHATVVGDEARLFMRSPDGPPSGGAAPDDAAELAGLIAEVANGDANAFGVLYDRTSSRVYGMVLRVLRDPGYSEETTQEVYIQAWRTADSFDPARGSAVSWLLTLAHRRAVDRVRSEQASANRHALYETTNIAADFDQVSEEVTRRLEHRSVLDCLGTLTDTQRESVTLAYYGSHTYREVAAQLGVPVPTVKSRIRDGLLRLRGCLGVM